MEQAFTYSNEVNPLCVAIVLHVRGTPSASRLRESLDEMQRRHLLLRSCIVVDGNGYAFREMEYVTPIPLRAVERLGPDHWRDETEDCLNSKFDVSGPLLRATHLVDRSGESELVLVLHHAIMDGVSARLILHELLHLWNDLPLPPPLPEVDQIVQHVFPSAYRGPSLISRLIPFMAGQMWNELAFTRLGISTEAATSPHNRILHVCLPADVSRRINLRVGREGLSLNAVISAALLLAVRRKLHSEERSNAMRAISFTNLRPSLHPVPKESVLGCMISMLRVTVAVEPNDLLCDVAHRLRREIFAAGKAGVPFLMAVLAKPLTRLALRIRRERIANSALSFLGKLDLRPSYGETVLDDVHAFITNNVVGPELSGFGKILFGRIELDLTYLSSAISEEKANELVSEIELLLGQLAD